MYSSSPSRMATRLRRASSSVSWNALFLFFLFLTSGCGPLAATQLLVMLQLQRQGWPRARTSWPSGCGWAGSTHRNSGKCHIALPLHGTVRCRHLGRRPSHWRCCHFRKVEFRQQPRHLTPRIATCHEIPAATRHSSAERFCALKWWLLRFLALAVQLLWGRTATLPQACLPETLGTAAAGLAPSPLPGWAASLLAAQQQVLPLPHCTGALSLWATCSRHPTLALSVSVVAGGTRQRRLNNVICVSPYTWEWMEA